MLRGLAAVLTLSLLAACGGSGVGFGVALTIRFTTVDDATLATVRSFDIAASGGETYSTSIALTRPANRTEGTIYRPDATTRTLTLSVIARDASGDEVAAGSAGPLELSPGKTTFAIAELVPAGADGGTDGGTVSGTVSVYAGTPGGGGSADGVGTAAFFDSPTGLALDESTFYVVDEGSSTLFTIDRATLAVHRVAGSPWQTGSDLQHLDMPHSAVALGGSIYVSDTKNHAVRRFSGGALAEVANPAHDAGVCSAGMLDQPRGLTTDGSVLYVATADYTICSVDPSTGDITALAGQSGSYGLADGMGTTARFSDLQALSFANGLVYVPDYENNALRTMDTQGNVTSLFTSSDCTETTGPPLSSATICLPTALALIGSTLYLTEQLNVRTLEVDPLGDSIPFFAGNTVDTSGDDGTGTAASFNHPNELVPYKLADGSDAILVADSGTHAVRSIHVADAQVSTVAGSAAHPGDNDGARSTARFDGPLGLAVDQSVVYVADAYNAAVRTITDDAVGTLAQGSPFVQPSAVAVSASTVYVADEEANAVFKLTAGTPTLFAGGSAAPLHGPLGIAVSATAVYVADTGNDQILVYDLGGNALAPLDLGVANTQNVGCGSGLGLHAPAGLALDAQANVLYVAARGNCMVFAVDLTKGTTTELAGSTRGTSDGIGAAAQFFDPLALALDGAGALYVVDSDAATLRRIELATGAVSTFAGTFQEAGITPGPRGTAQLNRGGGVAWLPGKGLLASMPTEHSIVLVTQ